MESEAGGVAAGAGKEVGLEGLCARGRPLENFVLGTKNRAWLCLTWLLFSRFAFWYRVSL